MILRELFYFDKESLEPIEDKSYDASMDDSIMKKSDTRHALLYVKSTRRDWHQNYIKKSRRKI